MFNYCKESKVYNKKGLAKWFKMAEEYIIYRFIDYRDFNSYSEGELIKLKDYDKVSDMIIKDILDNKEQFEDAIYFSGGFGLKDQYMGKGIGKLIIKRIFEDFPQYKRIFLYAERYRARNFWIKHMKGTPILGWRDTDPLQEKNAVYLIRLDRDKILIN
jgi:GNAT superfamily N-acetyltransferase